MSLPEGGAPPALFDRELVARRYAARTHQGMDFVTSLVLGDLGERLAAITRRFDKALILGPDAALLPASGETAGGPVAFARLATLVEAPGIMSFNPEKPVLPGRGYDLVVSLLDLQIVDDVIAYLVNIRRAMRPDGLFIAATLGGNSLTELRQAWLAAEAEGRGGAATRVVPMLDVRAAGMLLQRAGFALPVTDVETHLVRYPDPLALMREIKSLGASNPLREKPSIPATRSLLASAETHYGRLAAEPDGRVRATLEIVWLSGWTPDKSQQKPLAPGSARSRLIDVLGDKSEG
ncbi:MAG: SAM-dependent methyltransferase [Cucumibacter sp.]